ncbi:hypothetical protein LINPERHAP1_LOCUS15521 [Linum perenne]
MVRITGFVQHFIEMEVTEGDGNGVCRLVGFYGFPERNRRQESRDIHRSLAARVREPWCVIGNFNDILHNLIDGFRSAVDDCGLMDLELGGYRFTWSRAKGKAHAIESQLDRAMVNHDWEM